MAVVLALTSLFDAVVARFALESVAVPNLFGWRTPPQKVVTGNRICWIPGDDQTGEMGAVGAARFPGQIERSIGTLGELFTVQILASDADATKREDERVQYQAARELYDMWYRAVYLAARGTFFVQTTEWMIEKKERRFGAGIRVVCLIEAKIPDTTGTDANTGTDVSAAISTTVQSVTELDTIEGDA